MITMLLYVLFSWAAFDFPIHTLRLLHLLALASQLTLCTLFASVLSGFSTTSLFSVFLPFPVLRNTCSETPVARVTQALSTKTVHLKRPNDTLMYLTMPRLLQLCLRFGRYLRPFGPDTTQMIDLNQALREKRPEYQKRQHKVILLHDNAPSHIAKPVKETIEAFSWKILPHAAYSPDLSPSDYYVFASMGHVLSDQHFISYENVRKWLDDWFASKERQFFWRGIHQLPDRWEKCIASDDQYFE